MRQVWMIGSLLMNCLAFLLYGIDKWQAVHGGWRISEKALLFSTALGGGIGAWLVMVLFHHKSRKPLFRIAVPLLTILQIGFTAWLYFARH